MKIINSLLIVFTLFALTACGGGKDAESTESEEAAQLKEELEQIKKEREREKTEFDEVNRQAQLLAEEKAAQKAAAEKAAAQKAAAKRAAAERATAEDKATAEKAKSERLKAELEQIRDDLAIPKGIIVMWSGAASDLPTGWALCDGGNGRPDLRDRFIVGTGPSYTVGNSGGSKTMPHTHNTGAVALAIGQIPSHSHGYSDIYFSEYPGASGNHVGVPGNLGTGAPKDNDNAGHQMPRTTQGVGSSQAHGHGATHEASNLENRPPYYALAFIIKL